MENKKLNEYLGKKNYSLTKKCFEIKADLKKIFSDLIDMGITDLGVPYHGRIRCGGKEQTITFDSFYRENDGTVFLMDSNTKTGYPCTLLLLDEQMSLIENLLSRTSMETPLSEPTEVRNLDLTITEEERVRGIGNTIRVGTYAGPDGIIL